MGSRLGSTSQRKTTAARALSRAGTGDLWGFQHCARPERAGEGSTDPTDKLYHVLNTPSLCSNSRANSIKAMQWKNPVPQALDPKKLSPGPVCRPLETTPRSEIHSPFGAHLTCTCFRHSNTT